MGRTENLSLENLYLGVRKDQFEFLQVSYKEEKS